MTKLFAISLSFIFIFSFFSSCKTNNKLKFSEAYKFQLPDRYLGKPSVNEENQQIGLQHSEPSDSYLSASNSVISDPHLVMPEFELENKKNIAIPSESNISVEKIEKGKKFNKSNKVIKREIKDQKNLVQKNNSLMSYLTKGLILTIGGLVLIIGGILLVDVSLILGSVVAGIGLIVFLIGFLGLIL